MKLFKKVLAVALAGVLALSVLTGCGDKDGSTTVAMVDALNDWAKLEKEYIETYKVGDKDLQDKVDAIAKIIDSAKTPFTGDESFNEVTSKVWGDDGVQSGVSGVLNCTKAVIDDADSVLYELGVVEIGQKLIASSSQNIYYASELRYGEPLNEPDGEYYKDWVEGKEAYVAVATGTVGGKNYMIALYKTTAVTSPEANNNKDDNKDQNGNGDIGEGAWED